MVTLLSLATVYSAVIAAFCGHGRMQDRKLRHGGKYTQSFPLPRAATVPRRRTGILPLSSPPAQFGPSMNVGGLGA